MRQEDSRGRHAQTLCKGSGRSPEISEGRGGHTVRHPSGRLGVWLLDMEGVCFSCAGNGTLYSTGKHSAAEPHPRPPEGTLRLIFAADGRTP